MSIEGKRFEPDSLCCLSKGLDKGVMAWKVYRMKNLKHVAGKIERKSAWR